QRVSVRSLSGCLNRSRSEIRRPSCATRHDLTDCRSLPRSARSVFLQCSAPEPFRNPVGSEGKTASCRPAVSECRKHSQDEWLLLDIVSLLSALFPSVCT